MTTFTMKHCQPAARERHDYQLYFPCLCLGFVAEIKYAHVGALFNLELASSPFPDPIIGGDLHLEFNDRQRTIIKCQSHLLHSNARYSL